MIGQVVASVFSSDRCQSKFRIIISNLNKSMRSKLINPNHNIENGKTVGRNILSAYSGRPIRKSRQSDFSPGVKFGSRPEWVECIYLISKLIALRLYRLKLGFKTRILLAKRNHILRENRKLRGRIGSFGNFKLQALPEHAGYGILTEEFLNGGCKAHCSGEAEQ